MTEPWAWRKSSYSDVNPDNCVQIAWTGGRIMVRDTKSREYATLRFTPASWAAFLTKAGPWTAYGGGSDVDGRSA